jgi:CDP-diacylglycerol--glycerol-3-phosphate 3-phosphatidyltransferase
MSAFGGVGSSLAAVLLFGSGHFFAAAVVTTALVLFDLLDGTMARLSNTTSRWGAMLDSTLDRISDAAILGSIAYWLSKSHDRALPLVLALLILGSLISYIKARAEALDIACNGGIAERTERLIIVLLTAGLDGIHVHYAFAIGLWLLFVLSVITVIQRLVIVYRGAR